MLGPLNEALGRRMAIIVSLVLYTVGAALEAGAIIFGVMVAGRITLGLFPSTSLNPSRGNPVETSSLFISS
jgi:MFS family permease